jgi:hypothetical protein
MRHLRSVTRLSICQIAREGLENTPSSPVPPMTGRRTLLGRRQGSAGDNHSCRYGFNIMATMDARGMIPESWACIDCGINTAPGLTNRTQTEQALAGPRARLSVTQTFDDRTEVYLVKPAIWRAAGMEDDKELWDRTGTMSGCLCIGCLEKRLGRILTSRDFVRNHPLNLLPGTPRLLSRRTRKL